MNSMKRTVRLFVPILAALGLLMGSAVSPASAYSFDVVRVPAVNIDFGAGGLLPAPVNDPVVGGTLEWDLSGGTITPTLNGQLYIKNSIGLHARMQLAYYDIFGARLATRYGGEVWASSNALHTWNVTDLAPYSNPSIYKVIVSTTYKLGNSWYTKASQSVYI